MSSIQRVGDLEIGQDLEFQRRAWVVQRIGWGVMALLVLAALIGLFGPGLISSAAIGEQGQPLRVEYNRFVRNQSPTSLTIQIGPGAAREGEARIWLDRTYLESVLVQQITPEPDRVEAGPDRLIYVFTAAQPDQPTAVQFHLQPQQGGLLQGRVGLVDGQPLSFGQFVYP
jgi:hypothetical protein